MPDTLEDNVIEMVGNDYPFFRHVSRETDGLNLRYNPVGPGQAFKAVLDGLPFQVNEFSLANYTLMKDRDIAPMMAIPVFLNRAFRHGSLYVRKDSDLTHPSQLKGKTIGAREYTQTAGVWWRGLMIDEYDLHWRYINWVSEMKQRFAPPAEAGVEALAEDLEQLVIDGEIDAILAPSTNDGKKPPTEQKLRTLFPDTEAAERDYFIRTGIYPLNHAVVIHDETLAKFPNAPKLFFEAYCASKKQFYSEGGNLNPWGDETDVDPIPFGLTDKNREIVATLMRYLHEQQFISKMPDIDRLFIDGAADWTDG
jgi:4,5-dihydroxyphthalate decarboxylase